MDRYLLPASIIVASLIIAWTFRTEYVGVGYGLVRVDRLTGHAQACSWQTGNEVCR